MQNYQNYERTIYADIEESLSKIVNKISDYSIVLDVGCSTGMLGRYLAEKKGCIVDGVDFDKAAIEISQPKYRFTAVKNLETESLTDIFKTEVYDYIVVADVIEHLINPDHLLSELKQLIKPHGTIIFSVPNITHIASGLELLLGYFGYRENGLLDNTHLRFYSKQNLLNKLEAFGHYAWEIDTVQKEIAETEFSDHISKFFPETWVNNLILNREDALTYQWLISTKIYPNIIQNNINSASLESHKSSLLFTTGLYWADKDNPELTEKNKLIGHLISKNEELTVIDFYFSECGNINELQQIRVSPVSGKNHFYIANAEILESGKNVVWSLQPQSIDNEVHGANLVKCFDSSGYLFQATNSEPQWYPLIDKNILDQITDRCIFRLSLKVDVPLLNVLIEQIIKFQQRENEFQQRENEFQLRENEFQLREIEFKQREYEFKQQEQGFQQQEQGFQQREHELRLSTSWRITKPLRAMSELGQRLIRKKVALYDDVIHNVPSSTDVIAPQCGSVALYDGVIHDVPTSTDVVVQQCESHPINLLLTYFEKGLILNPTVLFDHNGGGGSNIYTEELMKTIHAEGGTTLRVYCFDAIWFVQWSDDRTLFSTSSIEDLFEVLSVSRSANIVVNSLYGYPDIKEAVVNIIRLAQGLSATLDFKIHDFHALCPSPHLSNFEDKYCGIPRDALVCKECLEKNNAWYHSWFTNENKPTDIISWRQPFIELFKAATTVTIFDSSVVEILRNCFSIEDSKIRIVPHRIDYFKCDQQIELSGPLHIGVLGTLSIQKGGVIVNALYDYINEYKLDIPLTIVGSSFVAVHPNIAVHGNYTPNDLPTIISERGINVILMPSIIPETFSYTISEAMKMRLPIVAFDIGAQGNRVKQYDLGKVVPLGSSPVIILAAIQFVLKKAKELIK